MHKSTAAKLSAFNTSNKKRNEEHKKYIIWRLRELFNKTISDFIDTIGTKPDIVFTSMFILNNVAYNKAQIIELKEEDGKFYYFQGIRIVPIAINSIVAALCSNPDTMMHHLREIGNEGYDLIAELDLEYKQDRHTQTKAMDAVE